MPMDPKERAYWDWRLDDSTVALAAMRRVNDKLRAEGKLPPKTPEEVQEEAERLRTPPTPVYESPEDEAIYRQELARLRALVPHQQDTPTSHGEFSPEELVARRSTLSASEIPAILGISPDKTASEVWQEKRGLAQPRTGDSGGLHSGLEIETLLAKAYTDYMLQTHGRSVILTGDGRTPVRLEGTPWSCTPDRRCLLFGGHVSEMWGVEFGLAPSADGYGLSGTEEVPAHVFAQMQWSMYVCDAERWDVAVLIGGSDFRVYHLTEDRDFQDHAVQAARDFWDHVENGTEPPLDGSAAAKLYLRAKFPAARAFWTHVERGTEPPADARAEVPQDIGSQSFPPILLRLLGHRAGGTQ